MSQKDVFGLVCTGGGAHGAYQVGVLKYIHETFANGSSSPFQIFAGSSCGALNTTFYAAQAHDAHQSRLWLEDLWHHFHVPAYHGNILRNAMVSLYKEWRKKPSERSSAWALLDDRPLWDILGKGYRRESLEKSFTERATLGVAIAATEIISGRLCWFLEGERAREWNLFHSLGIKTQIGNEHMAASCSVPFFLPPVKIGEHYFLDGSISMDHPLSAAMSMGATRILSIATEKMRSYELPQTPEKFRPRISNVIRLLLNRLTHNSSMDEATQIRMLNRFHRALARRHRQRKEAFPLPLFHDQAMPSHYMPTEIFTFFPSQRVSETFAGTGAPKSRAGKSRFMFHEKFIRELINFGYEDAKNRHDELMHFFLPQKSSSWFRFTSGKSGHQ